MGLEEYKKKRDFKKTPEPQGGTSSSRGSRQFVIQKHDASHLHYDFRIEVDGVLKSWAVPKGLSLDPKTKRLAMQTEDHPLDYADFEGVIPQGYGAGTVMVWDYGTYHAEHDIKKALADGKVTVELKGKKVEGAYHLVHTDGRRWLLFKSDDEHADARRKPTSTQNRSAKTGRTMEQIEKAEEQ